MDMSEMKDAMNVHKEAYFLANKIIKAVEGDFITAKARIRNAREVGDVENKVDLYTVDFISEVFSTIEHLLAH